MLKNFKLSVATVILTASCFGTMAQNKTHKDVVLDGKPAKLDVKTGEVKVVELKTINGKKVDKDSTANTVIKANLITNPNWYSTKKDTFDIEISSGNSKFSVKNDSIEMTKIQPTTISEKAEKAEKATIMVYDTSTTPSSEDTTNNFHKVKKGETLYGLSKRYNTSLTVLMDANNLDTTLIKTGQTLRVRNFETFHTKDSWTVSKGDTLYSIAKKNNTTVSDIKLLNRLSSNLIKVGQVLRLK